MILCKICLINYKLKVNIKILCLLNLKNLNNNDFYIIYLKNEILLIYIFKN